MKRAVLTCFLLAVALASSLYGALCMPKIFSDGMVLQRDMPVKIWGTADAGAEIKAEFGDVKASARAGADGKWSLTLPKMKADKNPRELAVFENGKEGKRIRDVLVGEVWVLGGQSNMEWRLRDSSGAAEAMARAHYPQMRYFLQPSIVAEYPQNDSPEGSRWIVADGENTGAFSGVGFFFGERLLKELDVPVGFVYASRGATKMSCWIPEEDHGKLPYLADVLAKFKADKEKHTTEVYKQKLAEHKEKVAKARAEDAEKKKQGLAPEKRPWFFWRPPLPSTPWHDFSTPYQFYNSMVAPVGGYGVRGVLWYQGEGDAYGRSVLNFAGQFKVLVNAWRRVFENKNMPFFWVQLASYRPRSQWALARFNQLKARDAIENSGLVNIIDCGEENDIHPKDKETVGVRLAMLAMSQVYGMKNVHARAPEMKSVKYVGNSAEVSFADFGRGLVGKGEPRGFEVLCGEKWQKGEASLKPGARVSVKSPDGSKVEGVRYLWKSWALPDVWLFNKDGLPAFSFTDEKAKN